MDPRPCYVLDGERRWSGEVLAWYRDGDGWRGVMRFTKWTSEGWPMTYEHALPASSLEPRGSVLVRERGPRTSLQ